MTRPLTALAFALSALTVVESQAAGTGYALVAETEHFSFYAYTGDGKRRKVDATRNERALKEIATELGVAKPGRITYYRHDYREEVAFHAGNPSLWTDGVADPKTSTIHSVLATHPHEIVHIVASQLGDPGRFFHEGLAVALGDRDRLWGQPVDNLARRALAHVSVMDALTRFGDLPPEAAYPVAGSFVRYLIRKHGIASVCAFFRRGQAEGAAREAAFADTFGASLGQTVTEWRATL
jgi:hypothetical protein